jgi:hypothetical protein
VIPATVTVAAVLGAVPFLRNGVQPAVEIAEQTPGRRQVARLGLVAGPIAAALARELF